MVGQRTLDPLILVRIQAPQPNFSPRSARAGRVRFTDSVPVPLSAGQQAGKNFFPQISPSGRLWRLPRALLSNFCPPVFWQLESLNITLAHPFRARAMKIITPFLLQFFNKSGSIILLTDTCLHHCTIKIWIIVK